MKRDKDKRRRRGRATAKVAEVVVDTAGDLTVGGIGQAVSAATHGAVRIAAVAGEGVGNALGAVTEGAGHVAGAAAEGAGAALEGMGGCAEGCMGCSAVILIAAVPTAMLAGWGVASLLA